MNLIKSKADQVYRHLIQTSLDATLIISFFRNELNASIQLEQLLRQCNDDIRYRYNLPLMKQEIDNIRTNKLHLVKEKFGWLDYKEKYYYEKLMKDR